MSRPLHRYIGSGDTLARLQDHAKRLLRLQRTLATALPAALGQECQVANLKDGVLVISCAHGAHAARLKQMLPSLREHFLHAGVALEGIRVKVAPPRPQASRPAPAARHISSTARQHLEQFAAGLPEHSELRGALLRLTKRSTPGEDHSSGY